MKLHEIERQVILARLIDCKGNKTQAAKSLGIGIRTLQRRLSEYGIGQSAQQIRAEIQGDCVMMAQHLLTYGESAND